MSAFARSLAHTCTIQRPVTSQSSIGEKVPTYVDFLTGQQCRLVVKEETRPLEDQSLQKRIVHLLLLPATANVRTSDRVINVVVEDGLVEAGPFKIEALLPRRYAKGLHHLSARLEKI